MYTIVKGKPYTCEYGDYNNIRTFIPQSIEVKEEKYGRVLAITCEDGTILHKTGNDIYDDVDFDSFGYYAEYERIIKTNMFLSRKLKNGFDDYESFTITIATVRNELAQKRIEQMYRESIKADAEFYNVYKLLYIVKKH